MIKWKSLLIFVALLSIGSILVLRSNTLPTVRFFPLDEQSSIQEANTSLTLQAVTGADSYDIGWNINSSSDKSMYLRQDVSLLFDNGILRGVRSKWVQNTDRIQIDETVTSEDSSHFQSISFHHGENHSGGEVIKSVQAMTYDELYVIDSPATPIKAFKQPVTTFESEWKELLDRSSKQQLLFQWHLLIQYFQIDPENYLAIPLVDLYKYNNKPLPNMSQQETNELIGRLWEGLYKNYIIPATESSENQLESYIPLILIDKQNTHLYVLFELNGEREQLIQRIP
ncbi:hypothetical protein [Oceanobacillus polygoni]|uniref:Uncharacterized protein n=1 Tax=Oceanobacillus polygoni TaxID=1235259 RepID=A0A9X1CI90_9BACI|nr:hypothetical protein [Oceanobacillus polygoni]MBP2078192.1 hypothetical protein [Oceanobacillus polygoni]